MYETEQEGLILILHHGFCVFELFMGIVQAGTDALQKLHNFKTPA